MAFLLRMDSVILIFILLFSYKHQSLVSNLPIFKSFFNNTQKHSSQSTDPT